VSKVEAALYEALSVPSRATVSDADVPGSGDRDGDGDGLGDGETGGLGEGDAGADGEAGADGDGEALGCGLPDPREAEPVTR
jgi:hypothetical protein